MKKLPPGHFTQELRRLNAYRKDELREWRFEPGMKFGENEKWWRQGAIRERPHEGLDLLIFQDISGASYHLLPGTAIPPLLDGSEVARIADFLGETVILAHDFLDETGRRLHTFYAHLQPNGAPASGQPITAGSLIGKIAGPAGTTTTCPPHLHLSLVWVDQSYPIQDFRWENFRASEIFTPGDPLPLLVGTK